MRPHGGLQDREGSRGELVFLDLRDLIFTVMALAVSIVKGLPPFLPAILNIFEGWEGDGSHT